MSESTENTDSAGAAQGAPSGNENGSTGTTEAKTPEWYERELSKVRNEAAGYRTRLRDAETKLADAKTPEEFESARAELATANQNLERELMVERAGRGLPEELRSVLKGNTEEELKAHAAVLMKFVPTSKVAPPEKLGGGLNAGGGGGDDFDVKDVARQIRLGRL
ncbi:hypothetical protein [Micromonospora sp. NBC_01813]|uniref:hypothetical protein n=1 Tax=Micromonospora sp. NBC_01813 TaxID=2975988 RepID=UPI002DDBC51B|nr:hypothetical protein [Micromonospora sp. NBC_01813]WSA11547.1 hypothetical protein OG958_12630 [Micromonospora sp. NBC_01813]